MRSFKLLSNDVQSPKTMSNPIAEAFARNVLLHLSELRADVHETKMFAVEAVAWLSDQDAKAIEGQWKSKRDALQKQLYREALQKMGLSEDPPPNEGSSPNVPRR